METIKQVYLYGASGHARVIMDVLKLNGIDVIGFVDDNLQLTEFCGIPVFHDSLNKSPFIISIGDCKARKAVSERLNGIQFLTAIHPNSIISEESTISSGSVIMAGAIIQPGVHLGLHSIVNSGASIDHDCVISDFVHIAPHCTLCGNVKIGTCTWIGAGTTIIQGVTVGNNCYIGAGSLVLKDIPDNTVWYGSPARFIREIL